MVITTPLRRQDVRNLDGIRQRVIRDLAPMIDLADPTTGQGVVKLALEIAWRVVRDDREAFAALVVDACAGASDPDADGNPQRTQTELTARYDR